LCLKRLLSTLRTIGICLPARRTRCRTTRSPSRENTPIVWDSSTRMSRTKSFGHLSDWTGDQLQKTFQFFRKFCKACDDNNVSEGEAFYMPQDLTTEPRRSECGISSPAFDNGHLWLQEPPVLVKFCVLYERACGMPFGGLLLHCSSFIVCLSVLSVCRRSLRSLVIKRSIDQWPRPY